MGRFGREVGTRRAAAGMTLRALARAAYVDPGHLSRIEAGTRLPSPELAVALDRALHADGCLIELARPPDTAKLSAAAVDSRRLAALLDEPMPDAAAGLAERADELAVAYLGQPAGTIHDQALDLRKAAVTLLRRGRPAADLIAVVGRVSGVLAYAALDLGHPAAAMDHAGAALRGAERIGDPTLAAWTWGTRSLIARFTGDYPAALEYALTGLAAGGTGPARVRLLCGVAQCRASLGDRDGAYAALAEAERSGGPAAADDRGVFGFSEAKRRYYAASSLIWLPEQVDARVAIRSARCAVALWAAGPPAERSLDDEALAHVYAATAAARLADVEQAATWLDPILGLPQERRISWIRKRMDRVARILAGPRCAGSGLARQTVEQIGNYT
jgi:transcriptional regulator with XRE-family HTH domain